MAKLITNSDYKPRDKKAEREKGLNMGGYIDLTPKKTRGGK